MRARIQRPGKMFHFYHFAGDFFAQKSQTATFLRTERRPDGTRLFTLVERGPLQKSAGEDLRQTISPAMAGHAATASLTSPVQYPNTETRHETRRKRSDRADFEFINAPALGDAHQARSVHGGCATRDRHRFSRGIYQFNVEVVELRLHKADRLG